MPNAWMRWPKFARPLARSLGWVLGLLALALVAAQAWSRQEQWLPLWRQLQARDVVAVVGLCLIMQFLLGLAWHVFVHGRLVRDRLLGDQLRWGQSLLAKYLPGKIWQGVARGALYARDRGSGAAFVLFVREQLLSLGISALIAAAVAPAALSPRLGVGFQCAFLAAAAALTWIAMLKRLPEPVMARLPAIVRGGIAERPDAATMRRVWVLQLAGYVAMCAAFALLTASFGLRLDALRLSAALCFAGLAGVAALFVPAGLGVREAGLFWCLSPLIGAANAAMLALAWRVAITFAEALFALLSFVVGMRRR